MTFLRASLLLSFVVQSSFAIDIPDCVGPTGNLAEMNAQVLQWKTSKPNQFKARAYIEGTFVRETLDRDSHYQFTIQIGPDASRDQIEVIYNKEFGNYPAAFPGMKVSACGDFINAFKSGGGYSASPAGAIIHWVHMNPGDRNGGKHPHGYIVMDGQLVGYDENELTGRSGRHNIQPEAAPKSHEFFPLSAFEILRNPGSLSISR